MKPIIKFYATVLSYLQSEIEEVGAIEEIVGLAKEAHPSWETTEEGVSLLERCAHDTSEEIDEDVWSTTRNNFIKCAFRDLSVLRKPEAMEVYERLECEVGMDDTFIWARKIKARDDGSAVIILHVSNLEKFRQMTEDSDYVDKDSDFDTLEECIQIHD